MIGDDWKNVVGGNGKETKGQMEKEWDKNYFYERAHKRIKKMVPFYSWIYPRVLVRILMQIVTPT